MLDDQLSDVQGQWSDTENVNKEPLERIDEAIREFNEGEVDDAFARLQVEAERAEHACDLDTLKVLVSTLDDMLPFLCGAELRRFNLLHETTTLRLTTVEHPPPPSVRNARAAFNRGDTLAALDLLDRAWAEADSEDAAAAVAATAVEMRDRALPRPRQRFDAFLRRVAGEASFYVPGVKHTGRQTSAWCFTCQASRLGERQTASHGLHLAITVLTGGLWGPVWYVLANRTSALTYRCAVCGNPIAQQV